jgi:hypothetical protein
VDKRGPGRVDPGTLSVRTKFALIELKRALANENRWTGVQVTFDELMCMDYPPVVDVKVIPNDVEA